MESKYKALSYCLGSILTFQILVKTIFKGVGIYDQVTIFIITVWDVNAGTLNL